MIDPLGETLIDLKACCRLPPWIRNGHPCNLPTFYRQLKHGVKAADGQRIHLETIRCPGGLRTSLEAVERFIRRLTDPDAEPIATPEPRTDRQRHTSIDRAERQLETAGI